MRNSLHPHAIHHVKCLSVRLLSLRVCLFPVSAVCNPTSSWAQCRSHRAGLSSFLTDTFASHPIDLSTPGRPDLTGSPCIAILWPRRMSVHGHLAAPSSPQRRTSRPPGSLCFPSCDLSTRLQRLEFCIFVLSPESCCPGRLVPPNLFHLTHYFSKSFSKFKFFVSLCHILFMMSCGRHISSSKASCIPRVLGPTSVPLRNFCSGRRRDCVASPQLALLLHPPLSYDAQNRRPRQVWFCS